MKKKKRKSEKALVIFSIIITAIVLLIIAVASYKGLKQDKKSNEEEKKIEALKLQNEENIKQRELGEGPDFTALQNQNSDVYAYLAIEGTAVDYPILQSADGSIDYLNTTIDKQEGLPGSVYTENVNSQDFHDANVVVYGHNMKDGSMFASLLNYRDKNYLIEHPDIIVYLPDKKITYHIYAAVTFDDRYIMDSYNFDTLSGREEYLNDIRTFGENGGVFQDDILPTKENQLITLSTCTDNPDERFLVVGVKVNEE